ncbi:MAG: DUF916 and DUF3324 domain-containing protein [Schleiferilactobacillus harbinensis]|nr:DUF916 and DUF3324 domain-containing protein [Schleiferilactobacillus harbinensis]
MKFLKKLSQLVIPAVLALITCCVLLLFMGQQAHAVGAGFSISPVYPDNQVGGDSGAFNIIAKPGTRQELGLKLVNKENKNRIIQVKLNTSFTDTDGSIQYTQPKSQIAKDNTIKYYVSDFVPKPQVQNVKINAQSTGYVMFNLDIPSSGWQGYLLGGFIAIPMNEDTTTTEQKGTLLHQRFGLTVPLAMRTDANYSSTIKLRLNTIRPKMLPMNTLGIAVNVQNTRPTYTQNDLNINATVTRKGSKKVLHSAKVTKTSFAPNSNYDFGISWQGKPLEPGKYHLSWKSNIGGVQNWNFERDFTISNADAQRLNNQAGFKPNYLWLWIILAILLIVLIIVIAYYYGRKKNKQNNNPTRSTRS